MPHARSVALPRPVLADALPGTLVRDVALVAGAAGLTALAAQVSVDLPFSPVPVTGQTFAVLLTAAALGPLRGSAGQLLYVMLGLVGLPVYSDGEAGVQVLLGASGGYLVGFVMAAWLVGAAARRGFDRTPGKAFGALALGTLTIYALGVPWLAVVADIGVGQAVLVGVVPFLPGAVFKAVLAAGLLPAAWKLTGGAR